MHRRKGSEPVPGVLLLLLLILLLPLFKDLLSLHGEEESEPDEEIFIEVLGEVAHPGVYGFSSQPAPDELLRRAGASKSLVPPGGISLCSGKAVEVRIEGNGALFSVGEMSAFYRTTLEIPVSLNRETAEGLTAVPGIGPQTALAIVRERARRGGFKRVEEIREVKGVGPALYGRVSPLLDL